MLQELLKDKRGEIRRYIFNNINLNILTTKKGYMRSGDYHPNTQYDIILKGKIKVITLENNEDVHNIYKTNSLIIIPPNAPRIFSHSLKIQLWENGGMVKWKLSIINLTET